MYNNCYRLINDKLILWVLGTVAYVIAGIRGTPSSNEEIQMQRDNSSCNFTGFQGPETSGTIPQSTSLGWGATLHEARASS